ncbi:MAG: LicD family protein [Clostridiales bacterium]|nr:LicD family protein [Clostridiales bacterium]
METVAPATGKLRELQLAETQILCDFARFCDENGLTYYIHSGTLLGAVRHGGFIPWDDDIDVIMPYEDYKKFLEIGQRGMGEDYFIQTSDTDKNYYRYYARIRRNNTTYIDKNNLNWDIHHGVWIDVFPMMEVNPGLDFKIKQTLIRAGNCILMDNFLEARMESYKVKGSLFISLMRKFYKISYERRKRWKDKVEKLVLSGKNKKCYSYVWMSVTFCWDKKLTDEKTKIEFEGHEFVVPKDYKKMLELNYKKWWELPPEDQRIGHGLETIIDLENNYTKYTKNQ